MAQTSSQGVDLTLAHKAAPDADAEALAKAHYAFARYAIQNDHYLGLYRDWSKVILFLLRKQWLTFNAAKQQYMPDTDIPAWRQQPVNPLVYSVYRSALSKMVKQRPALEVLAPSGDTEDVESAELATSILEHLHTALKMASKDKRMLSWFLTTGNSFTRVFWDPMGGKPQKRTVPVEVQGEDGMPTEAECPCDENGEPYMKPDGTPDLERKPEFFTEGEIAIHPENTMFVRFNPDAESVEDADEMFVARIVPKTQAATMLGIEESELSGTTDEDLSQFIDLHSAAASGADDVLGVGLGVSNSDAGTDRVMVLEYYAKPDPMKGFPEGRFWLQVGTNMIGEEQPLPEGFWPPLVPCLDTPIPGQLHAIGLLSQIVALNEKYNYLDAKILEHEIMMSMGGKWVVSPEDKNMVINTDPGQKLVSRGYVAGHPPVQARLNALPPEIYEERERILSLINLIAGTNDIGLGQKPEGVSSGRGFLVLQEVVDSLLVPALIEFENAKEEIGRRCLILAQRHYKEERSMRIKGERGMWQVRSFKGSDLVDGLDVRVQTGSSFPWSKSARMDTVLSILQSMPMLGLDQNGQPDEQKIQRMLDVGGIGVFKSEGNADANEIDREHGMFEAFNPDEGTIQLPQIGFWQNHAAHLEAHYTFIKKAYMRIARWHPAAQQAFLQHVLETAQAVQDLVSQMAPPVEGGETGAPPPGGSPSGNPSKGGGSGGGRDLKITPGDRKAAGTSTKTA